MNKIGWILASFFGCLIGLALTLGVNPNKDVDVAVLPPKPPIVLPPERIPQPPPERLPEVPPQLPPKLPNPPQPEVEPDLIGVQVPIPKNCRVYNASGSQCVWCSIECLGRYHKVKELYEGDTRITKYHTWATVPFEVAQVMKTKYPSVKWTQITSRNETNSFIKKYVTEKKLGAGFAISGHMLNIVHYDEAAKTVKVIDNLGPQALKVQEWSMDKFNRVAVGWALTVFPPGYIPAADETRDIHMNIMDILYRGDTDAYYGNIRIGLLDFREFIRR